MYNEVEINGITIINDDEDFAKVDISTNTGHILKNKAIVIADREHNNDFYIIYANLTEAEKEKMFNMLDENLHGTAGTNKRLRDRILRLEDEIYVSKQAI